jgi:hypothetical protein
MPLEAKLAEPTGVTITVAVRTGRQAGASGGDPALIERVNDQQIHDAFNVISDALQLTAISSLCLTLKSPCADETAAKAAPSQNDADRGLSNAQLSRNLLLRLALVAQRLDLLGQPRVDNLAAHGNLPRSRLLGG